MRLVSAFVLATLLASPVLAQDAAPAAPAAEPAPAPAEPAPAPEPAPVTLPALTDIGPNADRDFWCALAFSLTSRAAQIGGNAPASTLEAQKSQVLFANLVTTMKAGNFTEQQFNALTAKYTIALLDPFATPAFTLEACATALTEAEASLAAAQAAQAATPEAPADAAPAPDAPAAPAAP